MKALKFLSAAALSLMSTAALIGPVSVSAEGSHPLFRLYNPNTGEHFYTAYHNEMSSLTNGGWKYEGVAWYSQDSGWYVYRLLNPNTGDHHYTMDQNERNTLIKAGWKYEGIGWASTDLGWANPANADGVPVYRLYNPNAQTATHHYTTDANERDYLASIGWIPEGVAWYAVSAG